MRKISDKTLLKPRIYEFHDYRDFLTAWFDYLKAAKKGFSVRKLAIESKISIGYLSMVLSKKRPLSTKALSKIIHRLSLNTSEKNYLTLLRDFAENPSHEARLEALKGIQRFTEYRSKNQSEVETYRYMKNWYSVAIREMAALKDFNVDPEWIQQQLVEKVSLAEIKRAIDFLFEAGFLTIDEKGRVSPPDKGFDCFGDVYRLALAEFHSQLLTLARSSIHHVSSDKRDIRGQTLAIKAKDFEKVRAILEKARLDIAELGVEGQESERVIHVALAAFPLTR